MLKVRCRRRTFCMSEFPSTFRAVTPSKLLITILLLLLDRLLHRILLCKQLEWDPKKIKQEKKEQEMKARQAAAAGSTTAGSEQVTVSLLSSPAPSLSFFPLFMPFLNAIAVWFCVVIHMISQNLPRNLLCSQFTP